MKHSISLSVFIFTSLLLTSTPSHANIFDFVKLSNARSSYNTNDFNSSAEIYEEYAKRTNNGEAYYNAGNSYYKEGVYLKALSAYSFARIEDENLRSYKLSNMGNALVHLGTQNTLERAIKHYEASLKIKEDKDTRENLEAVQKALKEQKETEEKEEEKKYSQHKGDEADSGTEEADDTNNKNKNKNSDNKDKSKTTKPDKAEAQKDEDENEGKNESNGEDSQNNNSSPDIQKQVKELKNKDKGEDTGKSIETKITSKGKFMSAAEKAKWFNKLDSKQNTYLYRLNEQRAKNNERNDKPW